MATAINKGVLYNVKVYIGVEDEDKLSDGMLLVHIRGAVSRLAQMTHIDGTAYAWLDESTQFDDIFGEIPELGMIVEFICIQTSLLYDPTVSSAVLAARQEQLKWLQWRINLTAGA